jgi:outer membrane protein TolC
VLDETRSYLLPRVDANATFTEQGPIPSFTFTSPSATPGEPARTEQIRLGNPFTRNISVGATYDPDPFGRLRANREAARRNVRVARGQYYTAQNELVYAVQSLYLQALRSQELISVAREAVEAASEQLRVSEAGLRAGTAAEFDVLRARVQVSNNRQQLVTAEGTYRRALAALAQELSQPGTTRIELVPVALPPEPDRVAAATARTVIEPPAETPREAGTGLPGSDIIETPVPQSLDRALSEAFNRRPEIYSAEWSRRAAQSRVKFERLGNYPSVALGANFFYNPDAAGFAAVTKSYSLVANIAIPIWDAGLARARTRQAKANVDIAAAQLRTTKDQVTEEVRRALADLEDATERRRSAQANTAQAREALRVARVRYEAGLGTIVEVTDAEAALTQARANEVNAGYDYVSALAALNRSLGRYANETLTGAP